MAELRGFAQLRQENGAFVSACDNIADLAGEFRDYLAQGPTIAGESSGWTEADAVSIFHWTALEDQLRWFPLEVPSLPDSSNDERVFLDYQQFAGFRNTYHDALPFLEPERRWWHHVVTRPGIGVPFCFPPEQVPQRLGRFEERLVIAGIHRVVSGRELAERWVNWRGDAHDYADQYTRELAMDSLDSLVRLIRR